MKNVVFAIVIAAAIPFTNLAFGQDIDSLVLSSVEAVPGDTAVIQLFLRNQSFSVGGFRADKRPGGVFYRAIGCSGRDVGKTGKDEDIQLAIAIRRYNGRGAGGS